MTLNTARVGSARNSGGRSASPSPTASAPIKPTSVLNSQRQIEAWMMAGIAQGRTMIARRMPRSGRTTQKLASAMLNPSTNSSVTAATVKRTVKRMRAPELAAGQHLAVVGQSDEAAPRASGCCTPGRTGCRCPSGRWDRTGTAPAPGRRGRGRAGRWWTRVGASGHRESNSRADSDEAPQGLGNAFPGPEGPSVLSARGFPIPGAIDRARRSARTRRSAPAQPA